MRQTTHFLATLLFMVGLAATCQARQNNDRQVTTYDFVDFQQLQVSGIVEVHFTQDKHYSISVEESTNPDLMTMVKKKGETLCIWTEIKKEKHPIGQRRQTHRTYHRTKAERTAAERCHENNNVREIGNGCTLYLRFGSLQMPVWQHLLHRHGHQQQRGLKHQYRDGDVQFAESELLWSL